MNITQQWGVNRPERRPAGTSCPGLRGHREGPPGSSETPPRPLSGGPRWRCRSTERESEREAVRGTASAHGSLSRSCLHRGPRTDCEVAAHQTVITARGEAQGQGVGGAARPPRLWAESCHRCQSLWAPLGSQLRPSGVHRCLAPGTAFPPGASALPVLPMRTPVLRKSPTGGPMLTGLHLQSPYFQIGSRSLGLGVRVVAPLLRGHTGALGLDPGGL